MDDGCGQWTQPPLGKNTFHTPHHNTHHTTPHHPITLHGALTSVTSSRADMSGGTITSSTHTTGNVIWYGYGREARYMYSDSGCGMWLFNVWLFCDCDYSVGWFFSKCDY